PPFRFLASFRWADLIRWRPLRNPFFLSIRILQLSINDLASRRVIADSTLVVSSGSIQILLLPEPRRLAASRFWLLRLTCLLPPRWRHPSLTPPLSLAVGLPLLLPLYRLVWMEFLFLPNLEPLLWLAPRL